MKSLRKRLLVAHPFIAQYSGLRSVAGSIEADDFTSTVPPTNHTVGCPKTLPSGRFEKARRGT